MTEHEVSIEGNGFIREYGDSQPFEQITDFGIQNWRDPGTKWSIYFHVEQAGEAMVRAKVRGPKDHSSVIKVSLNGALQSYNVSINGDAEQTVLIGLFRIENPGYVQLDLEGVSRTGPFYTDMTSILFTYPGEVWYIDEDVYFGRRGPSVHFQYHQNPETDVEYFYNEVTVAPGQDIEGCYYAAMGFDGGYFGMQVNGSNERRILFSVWSEYDTEDPDQIPEEWKVVPLKSGRNVHVGEFGNEGAGAQSFLRYPWVVGEVYKFLVRIRPLDPENTEYTAWLLTREFGPDNWMLIASFRKPKVSLWVEGLYCFSENFIPEQGHLTRSVNFGNHWTRNNEGVWEEITRVTFTADATSRLSRKDIWGGVKAGDDTFMLRNCGFFSDRVEANTDFDRAPLGVPPQIDFENLP